MIPLDHPHVAAYLAAAREDLGHANGFADWLQEAGEGLPTLCWWLARCADDDLPALQATLAAWERAQGREERAYLVEKSKINSQIVVTEVWNDQEAWQVIAEETERSGYFSRKAEAMEILRRCGPCPAVDRAVRRGEAKACRDLRRRILALFPSVKVYKRRLDFPIGHCREESEIHRIMDEAQARMHAEGWARHVETHCWYDKEQQRITYWQELYAPDLIEPDKPASAPLPYVYNPDPQSFLADNTIGRVLFRKEMEPKIMDPRRLIINPL